MSAIVASRESRCDGCDGLIRVGEVIVRSELEESPDVQFKPWWRHETCPPSKFDIVREVCGDCFTEKAVGGACMCGAL